MKVKIIKSKRKTMTLSINDDLTIVVKAPLHMSDKRINEFINSNTAWINKAYDKKKAHLEKYNLSDDEVEKLIRDAKSVIPHKVKYYSDLMNLYPTGVKITRAKKRFGSCNAKNSLCFSCYLMLYPDEAIDYVVVHELAHIRHHNHSKDFYTLVEKYLPDYKHREKILKD